MRLLPAGCTLQLFNGVHEIFRGNLSESVHRGVPAARLAALGFKAGEELRPYGELLHSLPPERGVELEFWHMAPTLYAMAQQYVLLEGHESALQVGGCVLCGVVRCADVMHLS